MEDTQLAYLAGLLDAGPHSAISGISCGPPRLTLSTRHEEVAAFLQSLPGATQEKTSRKGETYWTWTLRGKPAALAISRMRRFLRARGRDARLVYARHAQPHRPESFRTPSGPIYDDELPY